MMMEAATSQGLQVEWASWRPRTPKVEFHSKLEGLRCKRTNGISFSPKPGRLKTQEEPVFQFELEDRKILLSQFDGSQAGGILS